MVCLVGNGMSSLTAAKVSKEGCREDLPCLESVVFNSNRENQCDFGKTLPGSLGERRNCGSFVRPVLFLAAAVLLPGKPGSG